MILIEVTEIIRINLYSALQGMFSDTTTGEHTHTLYIKFFSRFRCPTVIQANRRKSSFRINSLQVK
jgi:hypothetical protein